MEKIKIANELLKNSTNKYVKEFIKDYNYKRLCVIWKHKR